MNATQIQKTEKQFASPAKQVYPAAPFPRKYVHCVFDDLQDAVQASLTLLPSDYEGNSIQVLTSQEYLNAIEERQTPASFLTSVDLDEFLQKASRGCCVLVVRPAYYQQMMQVRHLLVPHLVSHMKYIDTWTTVDLLP